MWVALVGMAWGAAPSAVDDVVSRTSVDRLVAVVVEQHGEIVYAEQVRPGSARRPQKGVDPALHDIRSAGKSLTALAVGAALGDGHLSSVDDAVWPLLGGPAPPGLAGLQVRDLLTMSSPLDCDDWDRRSPGQEERMYRRKHWTTFVRGLPADPRFVRDESGFGRFSYCTAGVFLVGQVVQAVTGQPFDDYVQARILDPLGITDVRWRRSRSGEVQAGGQLMIGATSLARIGRLVLDVGRWGEEQVVPEAFVRDMLTPWRSVGPGRGYGYLWWAVALPTPAGPVGAWSMIGNGGNVVALFREADAVVVVQSADYNREGAAGRSFTLAVELLAATRR